MAIVLIRLLPPFAGGRASIHALDEGASAGAEAGVPLAGDDPEAALGDRMSAAVQAGCEKVIVDLDGLTAVDPDEIAALTSFMWSVMAEGAAPVIVSAGVDVTDRVRHAKMDRAFPVFSELSEALAHCRAQNP